MGSDGNYDLLDPFPVGKGPVHWDVTALSESITATMKAACPGDDSNLNAALAIAARNLAVELSHSANTQTYSFASRAIARFLVHHLHEYLESMKAPPAVLFAIATKLCAMLGMEWRDEPSNQQHFEQIFLACTSQRARTHSLISLFEGSLHFREDRQEAETQLAKEQRPETADELDEFDMMRTFLQNRSQMDPALLIPYVGDFVAWSADGKRIVAQAKDHATLRKLIREAGENPRHCVVGGFDGDTII